MNPSARLLKANSAGAWEGGSGVSGAYCSHRGPECGCQHIRWLTTHLLLLQEILASSGLLRHLHSDAQTPPFLLYIHIHIIKNLLKDKLYR